MVKRLVLDQTIVVVRPDLIHERAPYLVGQVGLNSVIVIGLRIARVVPQPIIELIGHVS